MGPALLPPPPPSDTGGNWSRLGSGEVLRGTQSWSESEWSEPGERDRLPQRTSIVRPRDFSPCPYPQPILDSEKSPNYLASVPLIILQPLLQEMQPLGALLAGRAMLHNSSHREGMVHVGASGSIIPVYCALLATVVLGLLAYVAFKCWRSHKQRQQLAKARTAELGALDRDQIHGDSGVFLDSPSSLPCAPSQGPYPELGCRLYLHLPRQQQEEVERLLELSGEPDKGWQGLAGRLGYQAEVVETMAQGQAPAYTLLRDWAVQEGSGATLRVLEVALAAMGREDVVRALGPLAEGCSVV
ncbi:death domain-containing membrane protein NRADD-like isoform X2 [Equus asinus]|uniref:death domain-containing membrane protein NRADD-like isoform X2 n=1 Tax=Equus asinus TaxID=9793 RepID=UPI001D03C17B|nr:death domain-containing membrane protein NRADD-like isoform X2 [Equus asinus]